MLGARTASFATRRRAAWAAPQRQVFTAPPSVRAPAAAAPAAGGFAAQQAAKLRIRAALLFRRMDKDGDGVITKAEIRAFTSTTLKGVARNEKHVGKLYMQAAFGLAFLSLTADDPLVLRGIFSCSMLVGLGHAYFAYATPAWGQFGWTLLLLGVNLWHISKLVAEFFITLTEEEQDVYMKTFSQAFATSGVGKGMFRKLLSHSTVATKKPGERIFVQGERPKHLMLLLDGTLDIIIDGATIATRCTRTEERTLIGEVSFINDLPSSATVVVTREAKVRVWEVGALRRWLTLNPGVLIRLKDVILHDSSFKMSHSHPVSEGEKFERVKRSK